MRDGFLKFPSGYYIKSLSDFGSSCMSLELVFLFFLWHFYRLDVSNFPPLFLFLKKERYDIIQRQSLWLVFDLILQMGN